ncbi:hypothetical protein BB560_000011 [Smittium megazygosporum]|uniref:Uncharacterized protein n=1 Tax=Smittium megazygosporum TaxID=133381 RepID=A0A2T9ZLI4_9FUNG|nr:hypothetical protein BB560_000011 [Smittium megazygosporum]
MQRYHQEHQPLPVNTPQDMIHPSAIPPPSQRNGPPSTESGAGMPPGVHQQYSDTQGQPAYSSQLNTSQRLSIMNEQSWIKIGSMAESMANYGLAMHAYEMSLKHNSYSLPSLQRIALIYRQQEDFEKAVEYYQRIISINGSDGETWGAIGHCYLMMNDLQKAYNAYKQALSHLDNVKEPKLWYGIGILYECYNSYELAEEAFNAVITMDPSFEKSNEIYFRLGIIHKCQKRYKESLNCFKFIINNPPKPLTENDILFQIGNVYELQKDFNAALNSYKRVLSEDPNHGKVLLQLGILHMRPDTDIYNPDASLMYLNKAIEIDKTDAQAWYALGRCGMLLKQYNNAYEAYQQAVYCDATNATYWCSIGVLYYQINQYRDALDAYSRSIRIDPVSSEVWFNLGTLYETCNNQINDAIDAYLRASELDPKNNYILERLNILQQQKENRQPFGPTSPPQPIDPPISGLQNVTPNVQNESDGQGRLPGSLGPPPVPVKGTPMYPIMNEHARRNADESHQYHDSRQDSIKQTPNPSDTPYSSYMGHRGSIDTEPRNNPSGMGPVRYSPNTHGVPHEINREAPEGSSRGNFVREPPSGNKPYGYGTPHQGHYDSKQLAHQNSFSQNPESSRQPTSGSSHSKRHNQQLTPLNQPPVYNGYPPNNAYDQHSSSGPRRKLSQPQQFDSSQYPQDTESGPQSAKYYKNSQYPPHSAGYNKEGYPPNDTYSVQGDMQSVKSPAYEGFNNGGPPYPKKEASDNFNPDQRSTKDHRSMYPNQREDPYQQGYNTDRAKPRPDGPYPLDYPPQFKSPYGPGSADQDGRPLSNSVPASQSKRSGYKPSPQTPSAHYGGATHHSHRSESIRSSQNNDADIRESLDDSSRPHPGNDTFPHVNGRQNATNSPVPARSKEFKGERSPLSAGYSQGPPRNSSKSAEKKWKTVNSRSMGSPGYTTEQRDQPSLSSNNDFKYKSDTSNSRGSNSAQGNTPNPGGNNFSGVRSASTIQPHKYINEAFSESAQGPRSITTNDSRMEIRDNQSSRDFVKEGSGRSPLTPTYKKTQNRISNVDNNQNPYSGQDKIRSNSRAGIGSDYIGASSEQRRDNALGSPQSTNSGYMNNPARDNYQSPYNTNTGTSHNLKGNPSPSSEHKSSANLRQNIGQNATHAPNISSDSNPQNNPMSRSVSLTSDPSSSIPRPRNSTSSNTSPLVDKSKEGTRSKSTVLDSAYPSSAPGLSNDQSRDVDMNQSDDRVDQPQSKIYGIQRIGYPNTNKRKTDLSPSDHRDSAEKNDNISSSDSGSNKTKLNRPLSKRLCLSDVNEQSPPSQEKKPDIQSLYNIDNKDENSDGDILVSDQTSDVHMSDSKDVEMTDEGFENPKNSYSVGSSSNNNNGNNNQYSYDSPSKDNRTFNISKLSNNKKNGGNDRPTSNVQDSNDEPEDGEVFDDDESSKYPKVDSSHSISYGSNIGNFRVMRTESSNQGSAPTSNSKPASENINESMSNSSSNPSTRSADLKIQSSDHSRSTDSKKTSKSPSSKTAKDSDYEKEKSINKKL